MSAIKLCFDGILDSIEKLLVKEDRTINNKSLEESLLEDSVFTIENPFGEALVNDSDTIDLSTMSQSYTYRV